MYRSDVVRSCNAFLHYLTLYGPVVTPCTVMFNTKIFYIFPTKCVHIVHMFLTKTVVLYLCRIHRDGVC